jgi:hypothetical protein
MPTIENYGTVSNVIVEVDGVIRTLKEWAEYHQIPYKTVAMRYKRGHKDPSKLFFKSKVGLSIREMQHEPEEPKKRWKEVINLDGTVDLVEVKDD